MGKGELSDGQMGKAGNYIRHLPAHMVPFGKLRINSRLTMSGGWRTGKQIHRAAALDSGWGQT